MELISTLKNHMQAIVILLMQSGMTFAWINQPPWCHYDTFWKWCHPVLYYHWLAIIDYAKQVHSCKMYISWSNMINSPSDSPFVTSPLCSTLVTVQLIIIDLLCSLFIVLEVLVIVLTLCVQALLIVICHLQNSPCESQWPTTRSSKSIITFSPCNSQDLTRSYSTPCRGGGGVMIQPPFSFYFTFCISFSVTWSSCNHFVTYCSCDVYCSVTSIVLWPIVWGDSMVPVTTIVLVTIVLLYSLWPYDLRLDFCVL